MGITADETSSGGTWRVRIRSSAGDVLGAGILLGSETVLTCAHVIPDDGLPVPATEVLVDLVEVPDAEPVPARVADGCWVPQRSDGCGDVALLRLGRPQPAEHAAPLYRLPPVLGRPVWMGGFPEGLDNGHYLRARTAGRVGPRAEWVGLDPASRRDVVRKGFSGAGVEDEATRHVIGMVVSRYDDPPGIPSAERLSVSYMIPVETILRHLPVVHRWVRGDPGVDRPLVSRLTAGVQDVGFAQRLAVWLRREPLTGRAGVVDVETVVIESGDRVRYEALSRAITLADRELSGGGPDEALSAAPHGTVPPLGSVDLAIDVTRRTDTEVALRVADRMDLRSPGDTSPLSRVRANAVPLTIVAVGVDRARDPEALVRFMKLLADRGSRLMLVFRDPHSPALRLAERLFRPEAARIDTWLASRAGAARPAGAVPGPGRPGRDGPPGLGVPVPGRLRRHAHADAARLPASRADLPQRHHRAAGRAAAQPGEGPPAPARRPRPALAVDGLRLTGLRAPSRPGRACRAAAGTCPLSGRRRAGGRAAPSTRPSAGPPRRPRSAW